ncbi:MAG: hypothetical protein WBF83_02470 [Moheibacter sp.]
MQKRFLNLNHFIFALTILFCLPCPVKRDLKKKLDVPVSEVVKFENINSVCASVSESNSEKNQKQQIFDYKAIHYHLIEFKIIGFGINYNDSEFRKPKIPLFKLNRNYRI